jgi:hypothetical protein
VLPPLAVIQASIRLGKLEIKFCMYFCGVSCHSAISKLDSSCRASESTVDLLTRRPRLSHMCSMTSMRLRSGFRVCYYPGKMKSCIIVHEHKIWTKIGNIFFNIGNNNAISISLAGQATTTSFVRPVQFIPPLTITKPPPKLSI